MTKQEDIREGMAEKAHLTWQRWMAYMLTHLDEEHIERWKRQANTAYKDLPECERESDRSIVDEYSRYLHSQGAVIKVEREFPKHLISMWCRGTDRQYEEYALQDSFAKAGYEAVEQLI